MNERRAGEPEGDGCEVCHGFLPGQVPERTRPPPGAPEVQTRRKRTARHEAGPDVTALVDKTVKPQVSWTVRHEPGLRDTAGVAYVMRHGCAR